MTYNYQDFLSAPNLIVLGAIGLFLLIYLSSKIFTLKIGIFPAIFNWFSVLGNWVFGELTGMYGFLFGVPEETIDEFFANENNLRNLSKWIVFLSSSLVVASFLASFRASRAFMVQAGIDHDISWALPISVDTFILLCLIYITYFAYKGQYTGWGRLALFFFTSLSIYFNVAHIVRGDLESVGFEQMAVGSLAPVVIFVAAEFMSTVLRSQTFRNGILTTDAKLRGRVEASKRDLEATIAEIEDLHEAIEAARKAKEEADAEVSLLKSDIKYLEKTITKLDEQFGAAVPNGVTRLEQVRTLVAQGLSNGEIANELNVQPATARSYIRQLNGSV